MKYAINYNEKIPFRHTKEVDEIIFQYPAHAKDILKTIGEDQVAIIQIDDFQENEPAIINLHNKLSNHLIVMINLHKHKKYIPNLKREGIRFMFSDYARSKEMVYTMAKLGACSIYIVEELAFNLKILQNIRNTYKCEFRVFPNVAACSRETQDCIPALQKFFIRPEDISLYEDYIDVCEFYETTGDRLSVIYEIYKQEQWLGNLNDIIIGLKLDIDNKTIVPHFGKMRINCNKICMCEKCFLCEEMTTLAEKFAAANLEIVKKRKKIERTDEEIEEAINKLKERGKELIENESSANEETVLSE